MNNDEISEKMEIVKYFVSESRELLDDAEPQIISMEKTALLSGKVDEDALNAIFRLFHSLKGSAAFLDLQTIVKVTHEAETLLDIFRKGRAAVGTRHVNLLIRTTDFVRNILVAVEQRLSDEGYEQEAEVIIDSLQKTITAVASDQKDAAAVEKVSGFLNFDEDIAGSTDLRECDLFGECGEVNPVMVPELTGRFIEESYELLDEAERVLMALEKMPDNLDFAAQAFRNIHSFKGNSGFLGYAALENVGHCAETLLDNIRKGEKEVDTVAISFLLVAIDGLRDGIRLLKNGQIPEVPGSEEIIEYLNKLARGNGMDPGAGGHAEQLMGLDGAGKPAPEAARTDQKDPGRAKTEKRGENYENFVGREERAAGATKENQLPAGQQHLIRVDIEKLDKLLDLVGELVIAEAMVTNNQDLNGLQLDRFEKAALQLDKITRDIQEVAMSMRMIPLAGTFRKMVRLVRDLAYKENKKVNLEIIGEETEVDKTIIEQISDPLVHLIRNAVDHGIEKPEERVALGKPETGNLTIEAKHSAGEVWIIVEDDGYGLDREKILRKGLERGLIKEEDPGLKDEEVWRLIFEPGFSTAEKISNISGRGVGMDVVKSNIEKLRGKVDIRSKVGAGTMFAVRIPLTLAIIEGMVVKVGASRYTIPINSIKESIQPLEEQVSRMPDNLEVVLIRGELLPVIRLHELYKTHPKYRHLTDGILIIVENGEKKCCLFVDEVVGQQQIVIKGLSGYLGSVRSVSGCAILGDGDVSLILDIAELIDFVENVAVQEKY